MTYAAFILFFAIKVIQAVEEPCPALSPIKECELDVNRLFIPFNENQLEELCLRLNTYYICYHQHPGNFPKNPEGLCGHAKILRKAESIFKRICLKGTKLNREYLELGTCLAKLEIEFDNYWNEAQKFTDFYYKIHDDPKLDQRLKPCIAAIRFQQILGNNVLDTCTSSQGIFLKISADFDFHLLYCKSDYNFFEAEEIINVIHKAINTAKRRIERDYF